LIYILDTNVFADLSRNHLTVTTRRDEQILAENTLVLCQPVYYEIVRGLIKSNATKQLKRFYEEVAPLYETVSLSDRDWLKAAQFWADADNKGRQLSDIDLLLAALAHRLDAVIVSSDTDFDALSVKRENWRTP
jgi:tRNA(fMet)-specific endonuclease VapC